MRIRFVCVCFVAAWLGQACSPPGDVERFAAPAQAVMYEAEAPDPSAPLLARSHRVRITTEPVRIASLFERLRGRCATDKANACVLVGATIDNEPSYPTAELKVLIRAAGIAPMLASVGADGRIEREQTETEDLSRPVENGAARLAMLQDYRTRLLALQARASTNVEALIKLAEQLANVQSQIEQTTKEQRSMLSRIERDALAITIGPNDGDRIWTAPQRALDELPKTLMQSIALLINLTVSLIPFALVVTPLVLWLRRVWRRRRAASAGITAPNAGAR